MPFVELRGVCIGVSLRALSPHCVNRPRAMDVAIGSLSRGNPSTGVASNHPICLRHSFLARLFHPPLHIRLFRRDLTAMFTTLITSRGPAMLRTAPH